MSKRFREPDQCVFDATEQPIWAVWYGKGGVEGDVATEVSKEVGGWVVSSYQHLAGLIDDYDPEYSFLKTTTWIDDKLTDDIREAAFIGIDQLDNSGGEEEMTESLPR